jgi:hypothetical protein
MDSRASQRSALIVSTLSSFLFLFLQGVRVAFAIFAGLCVGGIFASLARGKLR